MKVIETKWRLGKVGNVTFVVTHSFNVEHDMMLEKNVVRTIKTLCIHSIFSIYLYPLSHLIFYRTI